MGIDLVRVITSLSKLALRTKRRMDKNKVSQESIVEQVQAANLTEANIGAAKKQLEHWLSHPNELGCIPAKIEYTNSFRDKDGIECLIFKYQKTLQDKWLLGIVSDSGVFSEMQEYHKDTEIQDAAKIVEMLKNHWKAEAKKAELTLEDKIQKNADTAVEYGNRFDKVLDFSEKSISDLEEILDYYSKDIPKSKPTEGQIWSMAFIFGAYLGVTMLKNGLLEKRYHWDIKGDRIPLLNRDDKSYIMPLDKVYKRLVNGEEDSIRSFYDVIMSDQSTSE